MQVGDNDIQWDFSQEFARELLSSVQVVGTAEGQSIKRLDGSNFKTYWAGTVLRIDILDAPPAQHP
jgi:hypothetical protein